MSMGNEKDLRSMTLKENLPEELLPAIQCVQCGKCSSGCPVAFDTSHTPRKLLRFLQWGWLEDASRSPFVPLCAQCQTCTVRCPRGIDVSGVVLALQRTGRARGWIRPDSFHKTLEEMIERTGRVSELRLGLLVAMRRLPVHPLEDLILFFKMLLRGKLG
jgi:heterodisulfide reductase subunit C